MATRTNACTAVLLAATLAWASGCATHHRNNAGTFVAGMRIDGDVLEVTGCRLWYEETTEDETPLIVLFILLLPLMIMSGAGPGGGGGGGGSEWSVTQTDCRVRKIKLRSYMPASCVVPLRSWHAVRARADAARPAESREACVSRRSAALKRMHAEVVLEERMRLLEEVPDCSALVNPSSAPWPRAPSDEEIAQAWSALPLECRTYLSEDR